MSEMALTFKADLIYFAVAQEGFFFFFASCLPLLTFCRDTAGDGKLCLCLVPGVEILFPFVHFMRKQTHARVRGDTTNQRRQADTSRRHDEPGESFSYICWMFAFLWERKTKKK